MRLSNHMNIILKRIAVLISFGALLSLLGTGCETAHGFGKDVEKTGEKIQEGTK